MNISLFLWANEVQIVFICRSALCSHSLYARLKLLCMVGMLPSSQTRISTVSMGLEKQGVWAWFKALILTWSITTLTAWLNKQPTDHTDHEDLEVWVLVTSQWNEKATFWVMVPLLDGLLPVIQMRILFEWKGIGPCRRLSILDGISKF